MTGIKFIGSKSDKIKDEIKHKVVWKLEELGNAFRFYMPGFKNEELLIEFDELTAAGPAYENQMPLNFLDVLKKLEKLAANFDGIQAAEDVLLIRKRHEFSRGVEMRNGRKKLFFRDPSLKTINFLDFYREYILTNIDREAK